MDNKFIKKIISQICNNKIFTLLILYLFIGAIFTSFQYSDSVYFYVLIQTLTNKIYITIFVFPVMIVLSLYSYTLIDNTFYMIRMHCKKRVFKVFIKLGINFSLLYLFIVMLIIGISVNLTQHDNVFNTFSLGYNVPDLLVFLVSIIKIYFFMIIYFLATINLIIKTKKYQFTLVILLISLMIIFLNSKWYFSGLLSFFNVDTHFYNWSEFNNICRSIICTSIFDSITISILYNMLRKNTIERL